MIMNNYHTHSFYCGHAGGTVREYVITAIEKGLNVLGFSEHAPVPLFSDRMKYEDFLSFLKDIEDCQREFSGQIILLKGLEMEYIEDKLNYIKELRDKLDFMCFGAHFYNDGPDMVNKSTYDLKTPLQLEEYKDYTIRAIKSGLFDFIAHPDLYMIKYPRFDDECEKIAHEICKAAEEYNIPLEINANGIRRGLKNKEDGTYYAYPCYKFWDVAKNYKIRIIVNSDCHRPKFLKDEALDEAYLFAQSLGLEIVYELPIKERG